MEKKEAKRRRQLWWMPNLQMAQYSLIAMRPMKSWVQTMKKPHQPKSNLLGQWENPNFVSGD